MIYIQGMTRSLAPISTTCPPLNLWCVIDAQYLSVLDIGVEEGGRVALFADKPPTPPRVRPSPSMMVSCHVPYSYFYFSLFGMCPK